MSFGVETTLKITGWIILLAVSTLIYAGRYLPSLDTHLIPIIVWVFYLCGVLILFYMGYKSVFVKKIIFNKPLQERYRVLDMTMLCLMITVLMIRIS